jgi:hypothetical protein
VAILLRSSKHRYMHSLSRSNFPCRCHISACTTHKYSRRTHHRSSQRTLFSALCIRTHTSAIININISGISPSADEHRIRRPLDIIAEPKSRAPLRLLHCLIRRLFSAACALMHEDESEGGADRVFESFAATVPKARYQLWMS